MYGILISKSALADLTTQHNAKFKSRIISDIQDIANEPHSKRIKSIKKNILGTFYVNCGPRYCVVLDMDHDNETISILAVWHRAYLHNLVNGRTKLKSTSSPTAS